MPSNVEWRVRLCNLHVAIPQALWVAHGSARFLSLPSYYYGEAHWRGVMAARPPVGRYGLCPRQVLQVNCHLQCTATPFAGALWGLAYYDVACQGAIGKNVAKMLAELLRGALAHAMVAATAVHMGTSIRKTRPPGLWPYLCAWGDVRSCGRTRAPGWVPPRDGAGRSINEQNPSRCA